MSAGVAAGCLALSRIPSAAVSAMAGILGAGAVGNGVAALVWERGIPNPLVVDAGAAVIAFNFADVLTLVGILLLTVELGSVTIRNREQLVPPHEFARMLWERVRS